MSEKQILHGKGTWADAETDGLGGADVSSRFFFFFFKLYQIVLGAGEFEFIRIKEGRQSGGP